MLITSLKLLYHKNDNQQTLGKNLGAAAHNFGWMIWNINT